MTISEALGVASGNSNKVVDDMMARFRENIKLHRFLLSDIVRLFIHPGLPGSAPYPPISIL
jgi:hypothetical protein